MSDADRTIVQETFGHVRRFASQAAVLFFARLLELEPALVRVFDGDMRDRARELMATLEAIVEVEPDGVTLRARLEERGRWFARLGVTASDYDVAGAALVWTLEAMLGAAFTREVESAWSNLFASVAGAMLGAAEASAA